MKQKPIKLMMLAGAMALANMMLTACTDEDSVTNEPNFVGKFNYHRQVPAGGNLSLLVLDSLQSNVVTANSNKNWIKVAPATSESGKPCVQLTVDELTGDERREGSFLVTDEKGNTAAITTMGV